MSKKVLAGWIGLGTTLCSALVVAAVALCFAPASAVAEGPDFPGTPPPGGVLPPLPPLLPPINPPPPR